MDAAPGDLLAGHVGQAKPGLDPGLADRFGPHIHASRAGSSGCTLADSSFHRPPTKFTPISRRPFRPCYRLEQTHQPGGMPSANATTAASTSKASEIDGGK